MRFTFEVQVDVERTEGLFASRDELEEQIIAELETADPGEVVGDQGGRYEVVGWDVRALDVAPKRKPKAQLRQPEQGEGSL